jgi:molybdenum cofactor cytidylyltransferase
LFLHGLTELVRLQKMCSYPCRLIVVTAYDRIEELCKEILGNSRKNTKDEQDHLTKKEHTVHGQNIPKDYIIVRNQGEENDGIASSIRKGVKAAIDSPMINEGDSFSYDMFFQADQPYVKAEILLDFLNDFIESKKGIGALSCEGILRSPNLFAENYRAELLRLTGECGGKKIIRSNPDDVFTYPVEMPEFFVDIDTREDYAHENV